MAATTPEYRRLAGRRNLGWTRSSLWSGPDHLLKISIRGYEEHYRRYYYKDIQALTVVRTDGWIGISVLWVFLIVIFVIASAVSQSLLLAACTVGPLGLLLAVNLMLGPTCKFQIRTAVQTDTIEAVRRVGAAWQVIGKLRPLLLEAQGGFTEADLREMAAQSAQAATPETAPEELPETAPEELPETAVSSDNWEWRQLKARWSRDELPAPDAPDEALPAVAEPTPEGGLPAETTPLMPSTASIPSLPAGPPPQLPRTRVAMAAMAVATPGAATSLEDLKTPGCHLVFSLFALDGLHTLAELAFHNVFLVLMSYVSFFALTTSMIVALARLPHRPIFSTLRRTLVGALVFMIVLTLVFSFWSSFEPGSAAPLVGTWARIQERAGQSPWDSPSRLSTLLISLVISWGVALLGFRELRNIRAATRPRPVAAVQPTPIAQPEPASQES